MTKKKPATAKNAVKKKPVARTIKKKGSSKSPVWEKLAKELKAIIPKLDTEGLAFLVEQSRIHLYNMQVDELNRLKMQAETASLKTAGKKAKKTAFKNDEIFKIDSTGTGYYLRHGHTGTMFSKSEMIEIIKLAHGQGPIAQAGARLYTWFIRERSDVLSTLQIKDGFDKKLSILASYIKKNYNLK